MKESEFTRIICSLLTDCNALVLPLVAGRGMPIGWPDRYVHHVLWRGWIEFKGRYTCVQLRQKYVLEELNRRQPGSAFVFRDWEQVVRIENADGDILGGFSKTFGGIKILKLLAGLSHGMQGRN